MWLKVAQFFTVTVYRCVIHLKCSCFDIGGKGSYKIKNSSYTFKEKLYPQTTRKESVSEIPTLLKVLYLFIMYIITEWPGLEGISRIMNLQPPCHRQSHQPPHLILDQAVQPVALEEFILFIKL